MEQMRWALGRADAKSKIHLILGARAGGGTGGSGGSLAMQTILELWKCFPYLL